MAMSDYRYIQGLLWLFFALAVMAGVLVHVAAAVSQ
jgi:hypothetical protein